MATVFAGNPTTPGSADGPGSGASFDGPMGLAIDGLGNLFVADSGNNSIRKVTPAGVVSTLAGLTQGNADGNGIEAQFNDPTAVAADSFGNVYVVDKGNNVLRKIDAAGNTTTVLTPAAFSFAPTVPPYPDQ